MSRFSELKVTGAVTSGFQTPRSPGTSEAILRGRTSGAGFPGATLSRRIPLPPQVAAIYRAVEELEARYPGRKFTPDGYLVGSIGEVVAAEALNLTLYPGSHPIHDAFNAEGDVQIKMTGSSNVSMYASCRRLVVLRVVSPSEAEIVYDGPGEPAWNAAGKRAKNGQRCISLTRLRKLTKQESSAERPE